MSDVSIGRCVSMSRSCWPPASRGSVCKPSRKSAHMGSFYGREPPKIVVAPSVAVCVCVVFFAVSALIWRLLPIMFRGISSQGALFWSPFFAAGECLAYIYIYID